MVREMEMPPLELIMKTQDYNQMVKHVRTGMPDEVCGLLGGVGGQVKAVFPTPNVHPDPARGYSVDGQSLIDVLEILDQNGWDLIAIYHSHPPGERTDPSPTDIRQAYYPESLYVIMVPDHDSDNISVRAFAITNQVAEVPVHIIDTFT
jgi:proteasome lid subunit RPN8/RPN11